MRHCPSCHADYRPDIEVCFDCGGPLEDRDDEAPEAETADPGDTIPEGFVPLFGASLARELTPVADALVEAGIDCRIRDTRHGTHVTGYRVLVHEDDRETAAEIARRLTATEGEADTPGGDFDPGRGYACCPACGTSLPEKATECPECGLPLGFSEVTCPSCGTGLDDDAETCSHCGTRIGAG